MTNVVPQTMAGLGFNLSLSFFKDCACAAIPEDLPMNGPISNYLKRIINKYDNDLPHVQPRAKCCWSTEEVKIQISPRR